MLYQVVDYLKNNTMMVVLAVVGLIAIVAIFVFRRGSNPMQQQPVPTPAHDLEGMDNVNMVCDLANGVCHPQNITPEQEQHMMEQQQEQPQGIPESDNQ